MPAIGLLLAWVLSASPIAAQDSSAQNLNQVPAPEVDFQRQSQILGSIIPIKINKFDQVTQNSFNWSGPDDTSLNCEIGFTPQAIIVRGNLIDDQPFVQSMEQPKKPAWWGIPYGADGIEFQMDDKTSSTNRLQFYFNFTSAGIKPRVTVVESPGQGRKEFNAAADFRLLPIPFEAGQTAKPGFRFEVAIPIDGLVEPRFFSGPLRIRVRLHDLDGDFKTYKMMEEAVEKSE